MEQATLFGETVRSLAASKGAKTQVEIVNRLHERAGYEVSQQRLSLYLNGETSVHREFVEAFAEGFCLNKKERVDLAVSFAYGQLKGTAMRKFLAS